MTEKRLRNAPPGVPRLPRCEAVYPPPDNPPRTRFLTSDNVLFDVADASVTPSTVMKKAISNARRAALQPLRVEPPPIPSLISAEDVPTPPSKIIPVALRGAPHQLPNIASEPLEMALTYCYFHTSAECRSMKSTHLASWDDDFVRVSPPQLCELASAAYYLDIPDLVDLTCRAIADILSGKTAEQICTTFHVENDLVQSLIFRQGFDAPSTPCIESSEQQNESISAKPDLSHDEGPDSDELDELKQVDDSLSPPQLGKNTVEEVENWINGDSTPKKSSKKRRKKKKNKPSTIVQENSHAHSPSSNSHCHSSSCFPPLGDVAAMESSLPSSLALTPAVEDHKTPVLSKRNGNCVSRDNSGEMDSPDSISHEHTALSFDEGVEIISVDMPRDPDTAPVLSKNLGKESATVERLRGGDDDQETTVWSIRSEDSFAVHHEEQRSHAQNEQPQSSFQTRSRSKVHFQSDEAQSSEIFDPIYCSTDIIKKRGGLDSSNSKCEKGGQDGSTEQVKVESDNGGIVGEGSSVSGEGSSYIRCSEQLDKEVEDFTNLLGRSGISSSPSREHKTNMLEAPMQFQYQAGLRAYDGRLNEVGPIENKLMAVRREAQLVEREELYQNRADAIEKQIADLCLEREMVRDKLSLVRMELLQFQGERGD